MGYHKVYASIQMENPCRILNATILHSSMTETAFQECDKLYNKHFQQEIVKMCPRKDLTHQMIRGKRGAILIIGVFAIVGLVGWGLFSAVTTISDNKKKLEEIPRLETELNRIEKSMEKFREGFNQLLSEVKDMGGDYADFKKKSTASTFAISYLTTEFLMGRIIIREAARKWRKGEVYGPFMDHLNLTLPCGEDCPITRGMPRAYYILEAC